jgi:CBS domain-containing protein
VDVASFLAHYPPFDSLNEEALARVVASVQIEHFGPGTTVLRQAGAPAEHLYVIRRGAMEVLDGERIVDLLGEGEAFGAPSLMSGQTPTATIRAHEDTLCYLIPHEVATDVLGTSAGIAFLVGTLRQRIRRLEESLEVDPGGEEYRPVGALVRRPPVTCDPGITVEEAARLMTEERVSSLLVRRPDGGFGIITDRDLRTKVVAGHRPLHTPVAEAMTPLVETVTEDTLAGEVLLRMLAGGFHHFPVTGADGSILGVVTDTDLMGVGRHTPFALKRAIERAGDRDGIALAGREIPEVVAALMDTSADPVDVGRVVALIIDSMTRRLLELGVADLGGPPAAWTWLALGSAARHEQALRTDQDHALAYEGTPEACDPYFERLATFVTDGLEAAGIPRCRADAMASNRALRQPVEIWTGRFRDWMQDLGPVGSEQLSIVFDFRRVAGPLDAEATLDAEIRTAPSYPNFIRQLARRALDLRPPTGFLRDLVLEARGEHAGTLDVKHGGITIVSNIARAHAIGAGLTEKRTIARLLAAEREGVIDQETRVGLSESFRFLWHIRLQHHVVQHRAGLEPDDHLDPRVLGPLARQGMKEAFRTIARAQRELALDAGVQLR